MIKSLIDKEDVEGLTSMSKQQIKIAWHPIRFGAHNNEGVHGATPLEMLHALLLGIFKYVRDCFLEQVVVDGNYFEVNCRIETAT
jgi:hypothetical protein